MKVRLTDNFKKQLKKLDSSVSKRIYAFLDNLESLENPRSKGKALVGFLSGLWRYRSAAHPLIFQSTWCVLCHLKNNKN